MAKRLTATIVDQTKPAKARREIPDGGCPGLYLVVQSTGQKSWALPSLPPAATTTRSG